MLCCQPRNNKHTRRRTSIREPQDRVSRGVKHCSRAFLPFGTSIITQLPSQHHYVSCLEAASPVVPSCQEVDFRVGSKNPESVMLPPEGLHARALGHIKYPDALVLRVGHDQVLQQQLSCCCRDEKHRTTDTHLGCLWMSAMVEGLSLNHGIPFLSI